MSTTSTRRRMAGRFMLGAAVIALPLTASITYAESIAAGVPQPPAAPVAPAAPSAPGVNIAPPAPPAPPAAPLAPAALQSATIVKVDPDTGEVTKKDEDTNVFVYKMTDDDGEGKIKTRVKKVKLINKDERLNEEDRQAILAELRADLAEADIDIKNAMKDVEMAFIEIEGVKGEKGRTIVKSECRGDDDDVATVEEGEGDVRKVYICQTRVMAHALKGLKEARRSIAESGDFPGEMRSDVLRELDRQIKEWEKTQAEG